MNTLNHLRAVTLQKSTGSHRVTGALLLALALLIGATNGYTVNLTWTNASGIFSTAVNWDPAGPPAAGDSTIFTNDTSYTVSFNADSPTLLNNTFSGQTAVVTLDMGGFTWTVTNQFRIGRASSTATVYLAGGTLAVTNSSFAQLRIADAVSNIFNCAGTLIVTNGVVISDRTNVGASSNSVGTLVITGTGVLTNSADSGTFTLGSSSGANSRLFLTNGGKAFNTTIVGEVRVGDGGGATGNIAFVSGPTTVWSNSTVLRVGGGNANFNQLIITNGARVSASGGTIGANSSFNLWKIAGPGSSFTTPGNFIIGTSGNGSTNNTLSVSDGALLSCGGSLTIPNDITSISNVFNMGGMGAMSTGSVVFTTKITAGSVGNKITITNALFNSGTMQLQGISNTVSVLANGTWIMTTNLNNTSAAFFNTLTINGGTLSNQAGIVIGSTGGPGNTMNVAGGGKLFSNYGTIGSGAPDSTATVFGVGSVWSNATSIGIGTGDTGLGFSNSVAIYDGGSLLNTGTINIGDNTNDNGNSLLIGGIGATSTVYNGGSINVGSDAASAGNKLTVTNAVLTVNTINVGTTPNTNNLLELRSGGTIIVNFMRVRTSNTVTFTGGTLNSAGTTVDSLANNGAGLVVGDGVNPASYEMAAGGSGIHDFNNGGLTITNNATLRGSGSVMGNVTVLGTLAPGFSVGTIVMSNNLVLVGSTVLSYELTTPGNGDLTEVHGDLTLDGTINVTTPGGFAAGTYPLITHTNAVTDNGLLVGTLPPGGFSATVSNDVGNSRIVLVVTGGGGGDPFTTWQTHYFPGGGSNSAGGADPDGDGMSNTNEFLAGFNPTNSAAYLHVISVVKTNNDMRITYLGANGDSTYTGGPTSRTNVLEFTKGTANGSYSNDFASANVTNILSSGTGVGVVTNMVDIGGGTNTPSRYYRVRVLVP